MTGARYRGDWVASELLLDRAQRLGDRPAVRTDCGELSYAALATAAARVAGGLQALGVAPGDRVVTMLPGTAVYLRAWWGIVWAGAVDVPANNDLKGDLLRRLIADSGARVLVIDARWLDRLAGLHLPELTHVVVAGAGDVGLPGVATHRLDALETADPVDHVTRTESDLLYVMYTSGTTGPSKGVMHSNRSALWNAAGWIDVLELDESDVAYSMFPLFHVTARSAVVTSTFWAGGHVHIGPQFSPSRFWDDVRAAGATFFAYMGIVVHLLHAQPPRDDDADNPVRVGFGAPCPAEIWEPFERRFGVRLVDVYGMTEIAVATANSLDDRRIGTAGRAAAGYEVRIVDAADELVAPGVEGEIVVRPHRPDILITEYHGRPDATIEAFRNLWFHTGDRGRMDADGYLTFVDRLKDAIRRRGENVSSWEVEQVVDAHDAVLECAAYGLESELSEEEVAIAVVLQPGQTLTPEALLEHCQARMAHFAVPRYVRFMDELPKTVTQRLQKYKLREDGVGPGTWDAQQAGFTVDRG